jgi:uncharacterized membrane protein
VITDWAFWATFGAAALWGFTYSNQPSSGAVLAMVLLSLFVIVEGVAVVANWRGSARTLAAVIFDEESANRRRWRWRWPTQALGGIVIGMGVIMLVYSILAAAG